MAKPATLRLTEPADNSTPGHPNKADGSSPGDGSSARSEQQPSKKLGTDLEAQLDALLAKVNEQQDEVEEATSKAAVVQQPVAQAAASDSTPAAETEASTPLESAEPTTGEPDDGIADRPEAGSEVEPSGSSEAPAMEDGLAALEGQVQALLNEAAALANSRDMAEKVDSNTPVAEADVAEAGHQAAEEPAGDIALGEDLADQIQELLDQAKESKPSPDAVSPATESAEPQSATDTLEGEFEDVETVEAETSTSEVAAEPALQSADISPEPAEPASPEDAVQADDTAAADDDVEELAGEFETPEAVIADEQVEAGESTEASHEIDAIDDFIAEQADDLLGGEFETVYEALGETTESDTTPRTPTPEATGDQRTDAEELAHLGTAEQVLESGMDDDMFASPDELSGAADDGVAFSAGADDVARELDDQPEQRASEPEAVEDPSADSSAESTSTPTQAGWRLRLAALVRKATPVVHGAGRLGLEVTYRTCEIVNRPLQRFSPQTRHTIGYLAIIHVFVGSAILLSKLASALFGT